VPMIIIMIAANEIHPDIGFMPTSSLVVPLLKPVSPRRLPP